ncbi:C-X-C chemokine receptor type 6 [Rhinophrynus dorsalis]
MYDEEDISDHHVSMLQSLFLPIVYSITCISGLIGNLLIIIIFVFYEKLKTLTDIFLVNLAIADMLFLCTLPFLAYQAVHNWIFGEVMCKIIRGGYRINLYTSMLILTCITFDRFISITKATKANRYHLNKHKWGTVICAAVWIFSVLLTVPQFKFSVSMHSTECYEIYDPPHIELIVNSFQMAIGFFIPLTAMLFCYTFIIKTLINASNFHKNKSFKIIFTVVVVFVATQLPYNASIFTVILNKNAHTKTHFQKAIIITEAIAYLHACLNPILYFFVGIKFRRNFWKILKDIGLAKQHTEHSDNVKTTDRSSKYISASTNIEAISMHQS